MSKDDQGQKWTVIVTRPIGHAEGLLDALRLEGFSVVHLPCITFEVLPLSEEAKEIVRGSLIGEFDWIVFTSQEAVMAFADDVKEVAGSIALPSVIKVAVQGSATADAFRTFFSREADLQPETFTAEGLGTALVRAGVVGSSIVIPGSELSKRTVADIVERDGASVTILHTYRPVPVEPSEAMLLRLSALEPARTIVTFFSPSAFNAWRELAPHGLRTFARNAVVGPVTRSAVEESGDRVLIEANPHNDEGMVAAIAAFARDEKGA